MSLTDDSRVIIYDQNMLIILTTNLNTKPEMILCQVFEDLKNGKKTLNFIKSLMNFFFVNLITSDNRSSTNNNQTDSSISSFGWDGSP